MPGGKIDVIVDPDFTTFPGRLAAGLQGATGIAASGGKALGLAIAAGAGLAAVGFKQVIDLGTQYEAKLNEIQGITGATGDQMAAVGKRAQELGSDLQIPATSAADAAGAILELSKGGFTLQGAMEAARGTLILAAAAQIDGARAAEIQSAAINGFGLAASDATRVADVLANTANASAVSIEDVAESMKFVAPVAHSMGVSLEDTATAIGLLGNAGIKGSEAGTALRGMLASLVAPSKLAGQAIDTLGLQIRDAQGNFVGFPAVIDQLRAAQGRLDKSTYDTAIATAFGRETMSGVLALVNSAPDAWDGMASSVTKAGGAADLAAAKNQGLVGALDNLQSQAETVGLAVYGLVKGPLEDLVRFGATGLSNLADGLTNLDPSKITGLNTAVDTGKALWENFTGILRNARDAAEPVATGIGKIIDSVRSGDGPVHTFAYGLQIAGDAAEAASKLLIPVGEVVGDLLGLFSELPGPVQTAALAFLAFKTVPPLLQGLRGGLQGTADDAGGVERSAGRLRGAFDAITSPVRGAVGGLRQFSDEMRVQRELAGTSGESLTRLGSAQAAFETSTLRSVAAVRGWRDDVRTMQQAAQGAGAPIGTLSASIQALAERSPAFAAMRDNFVAVSSAAEDFGQRAGAAGREASEALGAKLGNAIRTTGDVVATLPARAAEAGRTLYTGLGVAALNTAEAIGRIPGAVASAGNTLYTGLGVAAINTAEAVRRIPGAVTEAGRTLYTGLGVAAINTGDALRALPGRVADVTTSLGTGLTGALAGARTALSNTVDIVTQMPGRIVSAVQSIPERAGGAIRSFGDAVEAGFGRIGAAVDIGLGHLGRFAGYIGGGLSSAVSGLSRALGSAGLLGALGGPWGLAIAGATTALGFLAAAHEDAKRKAQDQAAQLDALRGTLDKYSGAVTQATINEKASQLAKDGTLDKVKQLGVSTNDYVRAALGEEGALQRVQAQLTSHNKALLASNDMYKNFAPTLDRMGISLDTLAAAAGGSAPDLQKVLEALARMPESAAKTEMGKVIGQLLDTGRSSADLAKELGITSGEFQKIQEQTRLAAEASNDFAARLDFVKQGLGGLKDGAPQTEALKKSLEGLAASAGEAAARAGETQKGLFGVEAGAAAAGKSMQESRDAFIQAATGALGSKEAAEALANQIGLIPKAAETIFRTNATGVTAEMITLNAQIGNLPKDKSVTVNSITKEAEANITALGFKVEHMQDGTVKITATTDEASANFNAFVATVTTAALAPKLDLNTATAQQKADGVKAYIDGLVGIAKADADAAPGTKKADDLKTYIDGITGILAVDGNPAPGTAKANELQGYINGLVGVLTADANNAPGTAKGDALRAYINGLLGILTADANTQPGTDKSNALKDYVDRLRAAMTADAKTAQAEADLNHTARDRIAYIDVVTRTQPDGRAGGTGRPGTPQAAGGIVSAMAGGGMLSYAGHRLTPMSGGFAQMVPPNTWRIIGDRVTDDEAFIPLNKSARSRAIFEETARRMGYAVARQFAEGGVAAQTLARSITASRAGGDGVAVAVSPQLSVETNPTIQLLVDGKLFDARIKSVVRDQDRSTARAVRVGFGEVL